MKDEEAAATAEAGDEEEWRERWTENRGGEVQSVERYIYFVAYNCYTWPPLRCIGYDMTEPRSALLLRRQLTGN